MSNTVKLIGTLSPRPGFKFMTAGCGVTIEVYNGVTLLGSTLTTVDINGRGAWSIDIPQQSGTILYTAKIVAAGCAEAGVYEDFSFSFNADSCNQTGLVCSINWALSNTQFTAGVEEAQTISASGIPAGCALIFQLYNGPAATIPEPFGEVVLSSTKTFETNNLTFPTFAIGIPYEYRIKLPLTGPCAVCAITPLVIPFSIVAAGAPPAPGSCGATVNATCGGNQISVTYANAANCAGKQITIVPSAGSVTPSFFNLTGAAAGNVVFSLGGHDASTTYQVLLDGVAIGAPLTNCAAASSTPGTCTPVDLCSPGNTEFPVHPTNSGVGNTGFPVTLPVVPFNKKVFSTEFTNVTPGKTNFSVPIEVLSTDTTVGDLYPGLISVYTGPAPAISGSGPVTVSLSKSRCDFTPGACTFLASPPCNASDTTFIFSLNEVRAGAINLTTGLWYVNVRLCTVPTADDNKFISIAAH